MTTAEHAPSRGWSGGGSGAGAVTTLVLVRHGVTDLTARKLFSGGLGGSDPALNDEGRAQASATGAWLAAGRWQPNAVLASPVKRAYETARIVGEQAGLVPVVEPGFAEMEFGDWDGRSFAEIQQDRPEELSTWLRDLDHRPGGGESFREVQKRVLAARDAVLGAYAGQIVYVVSHVTPIKILVADAVGAALDALFRMELSAASVSVVGYYPDPEGVRPSLRVFNATP